jgi:hypothetical protein
MSGPQDMQGIMKSLGIPGGGQTGPLPTMPIGQTKKRMGDSRVPQQSGPLRPNPGSVQASAAQKLGVRPEQVQPATPRAQQQPPRNIPPPQPTTQAPPPPTLPQPPQEREVNPRGPMAGTPMPQPRPMGADVAGMLGTLNDGGGGPPPPSMVAKVLENKMNESPKPPGVFPYGAVDAIASLFTGNPNKPGLSSATAAPSPPPSDPFKTGAPPIQAGPQQLMQVVAAAAKAKDQQSRPPVQAPEATQPSPNVTPPVPRGMPPPPPPSVIQAEPEPTIQPVQPQFRGYEVRPPKPAKGEQKTKEHALKKENSMYYYTRIGVRPGDNAGVAQRLREVRAKAENPRTARNMTPEEDRILAQYNEKDSYLMSMLPADVAKRMAEYRSGQLAGQIPDRYQERPPGVEPGSGAPTPLKLPPKSSQTKAEKLANQAIQNPPKRNATDADPTTDDETPPEKSSSKYDVREE